MPRLRQVLLIDDNAGDNHLHRLVIEDSGLVDDIKAFQYAEEALAYLASDDPPPVDLIFLDINMPRMNGFEFLEQYALLPDRRKAKMVVTMLTTSLNPEDKERAEKTGLISTYQCKPLTEESFQEVANQFFSLS